MKTALFFGSFNPIHIGHIAIAGYVLEFTDIEELWFVVSPQNPLKSEAELAPEVHRLKMVKLAIGNYSSNLKCCDVEMSMPRPSYTIDTLQKLKEMFPERDFTVLMGSDSMDCITEWKDYEKLLANHKIFVYPRLGSNIDEISKKYSVEIINALIIEISSTFIRDGLKKGRNVNFFMPSESYVYMVDNKLYISKNE